MTTKTATIGLGQTFQHVGSVPFRRVPLRQRCNNTTAVENTTTIALGKCWRIKKWASAGQDCSDKIGDVNLWWKAWLRGPGAARQDARCGHFPTKWNPTLPYISLNFTHSFWLSLQVETWSTTRFWRLAEQYCKVKRLYSEYNYYKRSLEQRSYAIIRLLAWF